MAILRQIAQLGDPVLRTKTTRIQKVAAAEAQALIADMIHTLSDANGVGLAAPQLFDSHRVFIISSHPSPSRPLIPLMEPTAVINPKIISTSKEIIKDWEGCLSIPGIRGLVPRAQIIEVEYLTREGKKVRTQYSDFIARIFQHEFDHLEGIMFLDRLETARDLVSEKEYQKIINQKRS